MNTAGTVLLIISLLLIAIIAIISLVISAGDHNEIDKLKTDVKNLQRNVDAILYFRCRCTCRFIYR